MGKEVFLSVRSSRIPAHLIILIETARFTRPIFSKLHILVQTLIRILAFHAGEMGEGGARDARKVATVWVVVGQGIMSRLLIIDEVGLIETVLNLVVNLVVMVVVMLEA